MSQQTGLELRTLVKSSGELELSLAEVPVPTPKADEILVRIEASPINPSDLGLLVGPADMSTLRRSGTAQRPMVTAQIPTNFMKAMAARVDQSLAVGNEGAGLVVAAGDSPEAQALMGRRVAMIGGAMYAQYRCVRAADVLVLPEDATSEEGASCFVNPLTALCMVECMRLEGHKALVHTAAASNLGQMLVKICQADGVELVNIVRSPAQVKILKDIGARWVLDSTAPGFTDDLVDALAATGATLAFDATGGGRLAGQILTGMEAAANRTGAGYSRYGSTVHKQVYIYGGLDTRPTELVRNFGMAWGLGGWLLFPFMSRLPAGRPEALRARVAAELRSTFASHYTAELSLAEALDPDTIITYNRKATGEKYLIKPQKGL